MPDTSGGLIAIYDRYIKAARAKFAGDDDVDVINIIEGHDADGGVWVRALIFVHDDELEPIPGPTYDVWIGELKPHRSTKSAIWPPKVMSPALGSHGSKTVEVWVWTHDQSFTCEDDPDGVGARRSAHAYARHLRNTYPCAFVAVRPSGKCPLPIKHFTESSPHA